MILGGNARLTKAHPDLRRLVEKVAEVWDIVVLEVARTPERQAELVAQGKSKTLQSKHLVQADGFAHAVDLAPMPVDWNDSARWCYFGGYCVATAIRLGIPALWGGDWNRNTRVLDQTFNDRDHLELY